LLLVLFAIRLLSVGHSFLEFNYHGITWYVELVDQVLEAPLGLWFHDADANRIAVVSDRQALKALDAMDHLTKTSHPEKQLSEVIRALFDDHAMIRVLKVCQMTPIITQDTKKGAPYAGAIRRIDQVDVIVPRRIIPEPTEPRHSSRDAHPPHLRSRDICGYGRVDPSQLRGTSRSNNSGKSISASGGCKRRQVEADEKQASRVSTVRKAVAR
jgi:hypothetical protein